MNKKNNNKLILILTLLIVIVVSFLLGQYLVSKNINLFKNKIDNSNIITDKKIDKTKEIVYSKENYIPDKLPEDLNVDEVRTELPIINLDYKDVKEINTKIEEKYRKLKDENIITKDMTNINSVKYKYYVNNDILSLVVEYKNYNYTAGYINYEYETYNINKNSGKQISNEVLIELKNMSEKEVYNKIVSNIEKEYKDLGYDDYKKTDFYKETINNIEKDDKIVTPLFLDTDNNLSAYINIRMNMGPGTISRNFVLK